MIDGAYLLRLWRALLYLALTLPTVPIQATFLLLRSPLARKFPLVYHSLCCRIIGFRVETIGEPSSAHPTLYAANHSSYLDIPILGSIIEGSFVAKAEIAHWPFFGVLAKLQRSIFIDRRPSATAQHRDALLDRLEEGGDIIIFPEATSSDSIHMLPFKSALMSVAEYRPHGRPLVVQPVTVAYLRLDGMPMGRFYRPFIAWYGAMTVGSHLWAMLGLGDISVRVIFHPPVTLEEFGSRKALSAHCHEVIAAALSRALAGRGPGDEGAGAGEPETEIADSMADVAE